MNLAALIRYAMMIIQPRNLTSLLNHIEIMWWQFYVKHWFIPDFVRRIKLMRRLVI